MKRLSLIIGKIAVIGLLAMMPIMVSAVQYKNTYQPVGGRMQPGAQLQTTTPSASFQSTSTLTGSGSALSVTPMLGADGTATYEGAVSTPAQAPSGPRRSSVFDDDDEDMPIGDAVLPLLLLACAYMCLRPFLKKKRACNG